MADGVSSKIQFFKFYPGEQSALNWWKFPNVIVTSLQKETILMIPIVILSYLRPWKILEILLRLELSAKCPISEIYFDDFHNWTVLDLNMATLFSVIY